MIHVHKSSLTAHTDITITQLRSYIIQICSLFLIYYPMLGKHAGQLKRIAATAVSLLSFLLTLETTEEDAENIFYERFLQLPVNDLVKVNFYRHIGVSTGKVRKRKQKPSKMRIFYQNDTVHF